MALPRRAARYRTFKALHDTRIEFNRRWAGNASALVAVVAERRADGTPHPTAAYGTGLSAAQLTTQAHADGLHAHHMGGFDPDRLAASFGHPEGFRPLAVIAVGALASSELLPDTKLRAREVAPRERRPLGETFFAGG